MSLLDHFSLKLPAQTIQILSKIVRTIEAEGNKTKGNKNNEICLLGCCLEVESRQGATMLKIQFQILVGRVNYEPSLTVMCRIYTKKIVKEFWCSK